MITELTTEEAKALDTIYTEWLAYRADMPTQSSTDNENFDHIYEQYSNIFKRIELVDQAPKHHVSELQGTLNDIIEHSAKPCCDICFIDYAASYALKCQDLSGKALRTQLIYVAINVEECEPSSFHHALAHMMHRHMEGFYK